MNPIKKILRIVLLLLWSHLAFGQESAPLLNFPASVYGGGNQNWDITQTEDNYIYIANNDGLLEFNGVEWQLYPSPNQNIIRSVDSFQSRIFIGSYMEFGFYERNQFGVLDYHSLSKGLDIIEEEIFWHIKIVDERVIFQSIDRLYIYDIATGAIDIITDEKGFVRIFSVDKQLYIQKKGKGIYKMEKGVQIPFISLPKEIADDLVVNIFSKSGSLLLVTRHHGVFEFREGELSKFDSAFEKQFKDKKIFSALMTSKEEIFFGTISEGIIQINQSGELLNTLTQGNGLSNNTVLNLFEDNSGNIWLALDNGVDCLNNSSFVREYNNSQGILGTVYATLIHEGRLYLGSNQGLFVKSNNSNSPLQLVEGTEGQVWSIFTKDEELFCGHTLGAFLVKGTKSTMIAPVPGIWGFRDIPDEKDRILFGSYSGLGLLKKVNGSWLFEKKLEGFDISSRFFDILSDRSIWVNHESKGVYRIEINQHTFDINNVTQIKDLPNSIGSSLLKVGDKIFYSSLDGVFELSAKGIPKRNESLSKLILPESYLSAKLINDELNGRIWAFNKSGISYARESAVKEAYEIVSIAIPNNLRRSVVSFENLSPVGINKYILGKTNGYLVLDLSEPIRDSHLVTLNKVKISGDTLALVSLEEKGKFPFKNRTIEFFFNVPYFEKYKEIEFSYLLESYGGEWSAWTKDNKVKYENLAFGNYTFQVRSKVGNTVSGNIETYEFSILRPFFLSNLALAAYFLFLVLLSISIHKSYKKYFQKQHDEAKKKNLRELENINIKNEQKITDLKNKKLQVEIESKNRELAILTMNNIKRNDFLRKIRKELKNQTGLPDNSPVYKMIDSNLNSTKDWEFFEEAFNNADKEFLNRAKKICPDLNHNDLKFCTYIRLNLSAKEIASLLNISTKSVEVRRYRLRKKLGLDSDVNLTDFIIGI